MKFQFNTLVKDLDIRITKDGKIVEKIITEQNDNEVKIDVRENDYVIVTTGSMTEDTFYGNNKTAPIIKIDNETSGQSAGWKLWKNLSIKSDVFGKPGKFCGNIELSLIHTPSPRDLSTSRMPSSA